ncbi:LLM class flavin-dependent oxidoreductase [Novosphingobium sp. G106]|uniref:LLM class flavin-dependent oxidoreductase n=1 Tax=Novosphingobium sp. G106 TaxID=2849500 RepID=UPI001C2D8229|nr:LLM class flavin-dependent oxidoreductase [Novosphingobium sp. G106]MBV1689018.1 LLM class flavin-dependent oxidoreductase [Novosphingobium sp. G106]
MDVGLGLTFQNLHDRVTDKDVFRHELSLAAQAEDQGFDSIWTPEHHFTGYMMTPNVPQFLTWVAAKTSRIKLGTTVTVLPWQNPVRIAESFLLLDYYSEGRAILGMGRGLGKEEFVGFDVPMGEARKRFREYAEALMQGLETGVMEYDGAYLKQPRVELRPRPYDSFRGRIFASAVSPESVQLMASLDVGLMIIAQKPWDRVDEDLQSYRERFRSVNGREAPRPVLVAFVAVDEDPAKAKDMRDKYLVEYARSTSSFYQFGNKEFASIEGYEYYGALARSVEKNGIEKFNEFLADLQIWGRPEEVYEKLALMQERFDVGQFIIYTQFGDMPFDLGRANYELFARKVLPRLKDIDVTAPRHAPKVQTA